MAHRLRRLVLGVTLATFATLSLAGVAAAHECYNASRTAKADANAAANSKSWMWASEVLVGFIVPDILGEDPLTPDQLEDAMAIIEAERAAGVEVYALDRALKSNVTAASGAFGKPQSTDGRGIDHASLNVEQFVPLIEHLVGVYFAVTS